MNTTKDEGHDAVAGQVDCRVRPYTELTALERFKECDGHEEPNPLERLRFFCSLAMNGQNWLDVEPFFDDVANLPRARTTDLISEAT